MAQVSILVPGVGESITEGILARWLKPDGAIVNAGEPLYELETDKASNVVPAPGSGKLKISVPEGETVAIGASIGVLDSDTKAKAQPAASAPAPSGDNGGAAKLAPAVRRVVAEEKLDPAQIAGSGRGGRITKADALAAAEAKAKDEPPPAPPSEKSSAPAAKPDQAADIGQQRARGESRARMSGIRQKIAQRLVEAQQTAAILTTFNEADMTRVMALRAQYKEAFSKKHGVGLGFMSFFVKATIEALRAFPNVNSRIERNEIVTPNYFDIGVAVSTERGLMVPVVRDADRLGFAAIEKAIADFAKRARENLIAVSDLQGGTFTITNGGVFGSLLSTPILNPPQSGILGMHKIQERPVVIDGQIVARPMMYLALSYDHRMVDGREAVSFLVRIKEGLEAPERLMLEI